MRDPFETAALVLALPTVNPGDDEDDDEDEDGGNIDPDEDEGIGEDDDEDDDDEPLWAGAVGSDRPVPGLLRRNIPMIR